MTKWITFLGLLSLMGCAHAHLAEYKNDEMTMCGSQYAKEIDLREKAKQYCDGELTLIGKGSRAIGSSYLTAGLAMNVYSHCATYRCGGTIKAE